MKHKKAGFLAKGVMLIIILVVLLVLIIKAGKADTIIDIINITATINSTNISLSVSGHDYNFSNVPSVVNIQQNFSVFFNSTIFLNSTNQSITTNSTCNNTTVSLSCSCPAVNCAPVTVGNCTVPSEINLTGGSKSDLTSAFGTQLETSSGKITQDILFKLQPTQAVLEDYKTQAFNASVRQLEAERKRDEQVSTNLALTGELERTRSELHQNQFIFLAYIAVSVISAFAYFGFMERRHGV